MSSAFDDLDDLAAAAERPIDASPPLRINGRVVEPLPDMAELAERLVDEPLKGR